MKLCAIDPKELEEKILTRFAENQNDELLEDLSDYVINSQKEIERLNNIINKLEQWLVERIDEYKEMELYDNANAYDYTLYTLQELKGSDKE